MIQLVTPVAASILPWMPDDPRPIAHCSSLVAIWFGTGPTATSNTVRIMGHN